MEYFLTIAGLIWVFCGALVLSLSTTTSPELVACLAFSFGVMFIGLAALLARLRTFNATSNIAQVSVFPQAVLAPPALPPPVPLDYAIPIEEAINGVRAAARLQWIRSLEEMTGTVIVDPAPMTSVAPPHEHFAYPAPAQYFRPDLAPPPTELIEIGGEYYVDPTQHSQEATALRRLQQIFSN